MRMTYARLAAALLSTTALGIGAIEFGFDYAATRAVSHYLAAHPTLRVASVATEPFLGRVVLRGVTANAGTTRVTIGALHLQMARPGFGLVDTAEASPFDDAPTAPAAKDAPQANEAGAAEKALTGKAPGDAPVTAPAPTIIAGGDGAASAENVTVQNGTTTFHINRIDFTGTKLSSADLAALLDVKSTEPLETRLRRLNAVAIVAPEVVADDATPGSERHATFSQVSLSGVTAGKATAGGIAGISFTTKDADETVHGLVGSVKAVGLDLGQLVHVFSTVRSDDAEPIKPVYDSVSVVGVAVHSDKKNVQLNLSSFDETAVKARALKIDALSRAKTDKLSDAERAALFDDIAHSFEVGAMEVKGLSTRTSDSDGTTSFILGHLAMRDFGQAKVGGINMTDLRLESPSSKIAVATGDVGPFPLPPPKGTTPTAASMMPVLAKADFGGIDCDVTPADKDKAATPPNHIRFTVKHTGFVSDGAPGDLPRSARMSIDNLAFDLPPAAAGASDALIDMGYKHLDLTTSLATSYDANTQDLSIHNLSVNGVDMGKLDLGLHLVNVTKGLISQNQEVAKASALAMLIKGISVDFTNAGIVERALAWKSKQDGITPDQERTFLVDLFSEKLPASMNGSANVKIIGTALAKFVTQPKSLHIGMESKDGVGAGSMGLLGDPALLIDSLDVKATAND